MDFAEWSKVFGDAKMTTALLARYRSAAFSDRIKILDEFVALTCYHRKHAIRVLRGQFSPAKWCACATACMTRR